MSHPQPSPYPSHIVLLGEALRPLCEKLKTEMDIPADVPISVSELDELISLISEHLKVIQDIYLRLENKASELMNEVVSDASINKPDLYRAVGRFEGVIHDLLIDYSQACLLPAYGKDTKGRDLLIAGYRHILSDIKDWLEDIVESIADPMTALEKRGLPTSGEVTLNFVLKLTCPPQVKELVQWVRRQVAAIDTGAGDLSESHRESSNISVLNTIIATALGFGLGEMLFGDDD